MQETLTGSTLDHLFSFFGYLLPILSAIPCQLNHSKTGPSSILLKFYMPTHIQGRNNGAKIEKNRSSISRVTPLLLTMSYRCRSALRSLCHVSYLSEDLVDQLRVDCVLRQHMQKLVELGTDHIHVSLIWYWGQITFTFHSYDTGDWSHSCFTRLIGLGQTTFMFHPSYRLAIDHIHVSLIS